MSQQPGSQLRRDPHHGGWVLIAPQKDREQLLNIPVEKWPLQSSHALANPEEAGALILWNRKKALGGDKEAQVRVISNRFPLYRVEGTEDRKGEGIYDRMKGIGAHEMIIESTDPADTLLSMSPEHYALVVQAAQERILDLKQDSRLRSFTWFREWTAGNGQREVHPHSQLIASAVVAQGIEHEIASAQQHYELKERCVFCDMIEQEVVDEVRTIRVEEHFVTFCPYASRHPFEVHLFPRNHQHDFGAMTGEYYHALAGMIRDTAQRLERAIPGWRLLMTLHTAPQAVLGTKLESSLLSRAYHWHIEFLPKAPGSLEWFERTGTEISYTTPEDSAEFLRNLDIPA